MRAGAKKEISSSPGLIAGIDFGSKLAGTTCLCWLEREAFHIAQSVKMKDADTFLLERLSAQSFQLVGLDAPLSLPGAYYGHGHDYFFRAADRAVGAMSPMFLGGLTARAMQLKSRFLNSSCTFLECYPGGLARLLAIPSYKKSLPDFAHYLRQQFPDFVVPDLENWHQADSLLAWWSAWRYQTACHTTVGNADEGVIIL